MKPGTYVLEGTKKHYVFESSKITITPTTRKLPLLIASDFHLCGKLALDTEN